ncbi:D-2-hydroxyacid dehydrogenase [Clostridium sp.]|uniref:D-2-hydroxyacid dehydrogenase n=1 Tax=Clostridium sp. TaxID=1506 RepID=UPI002FC6ECBB
MEKIIVLDKKTLGNDICFDDLESLGVVEYYENISKDQVKEAIKDATIVLTNKVVLNEENLSDNNSVKLICVCATGTNNIDLNYARKSGIAVTNVAGYSTNTVAQHTFSMLFYLLESLNYYNEYTYTGEYTRSDIFTHINRPFNELQGKTYGIIGMGSIGQKVASIASAFGCRVIYYSTSGQNSIEEYERVELNKLLTESDIVSIHCPLNDKTNNLIGINELEKMKSTAYILNLGRGGIINEKDLAYALNNNLIMGAGIDVLVHEPMLNKNPLLSVRDKNKLIVTPHIGWASVEARKRLVNEVVENIKAYLSSSERNRIV